MRPLSRGGSEWVPPGTPMSRAGIAAAAPIARRRVRVERLVIVGGRRAAKRSDIGGVPFFLAGADDGPDGSGPDGGLARGSVACLAPLWSPVNGVVHYA